MPEAAPGGRPLNIFFDVDNTVVLWNGRLRNHTEDVFRALRADGHTIYIWSGVGIRRWDMQHHGLQDYVTDYFVKPLDRYRERAYGEFAVSVPIHYVIDDHRGVVDAFGGFHVSDQPRADDREMLDLLEDIRRFAAAPPAGDPDNGFPGRPA